MRSFVNSQFVPVIILVSYFITNNSSYCLLLYPCSYRVPKKWGKLKKAWRIGAQYSSLFIFLFKYYFSFFLNYFLFLILNLTRLQKVQNFGQTFHTTRLSPCWRFNVDEIKEAEKKKRIILDQQGGRLRPGCSTRSKASHSARNTRRHPTALTSIPHTAMYCSQQVTPKKNQDLSKHVRSVSQKFTLRKM